MAGESKARTGRRTPRLAAGSVAGTLLLLIFGLWAGPAGCGARIVPPRLEAGETPARVHIIDYGYHASLVLPRDERTVAEYAYGQWDWFALGRTEWYRAPVILLFPSSGAFGKRDLMTFGDEQWLLDMVGAVGMHTIEVAAADVDRLRSSLDARHAAGTSEPVLNPQTGLIFVRDDDLYWVFNNCNTEVAAWLRELGCEVHGLAILARFRVDPPAPPPRNDPGIGAADPQASR